MRAALWHALGFLACLSTLTGFAFALGYLTHTGLFA